MGLLEIASPKKQRGASLSCAKKKKKSECDSRLTKILQPQNAEGPTFCPLKQHALTLRALVAKMLLFTLKTEWSSAVTAQLLLVSGPLETEADKRFCSDPSQFPRLGVKPVMAVE